MTKRDLLIALMALPEDAEVLVPAVNDDKYVKVTEVTYFDKTEDNTIWLT